MGGVNCPTAAVLVYCMRKGKYTNQIPFKNLLIPSEQKKKKKKEMRSICEVHSPGTEAHLNTESKSRDSKICPDIL
jgi:hypothetical protein